MKRGIIYSLTLSLIVITIFSCSKNKNENSQIETIDKNSIAVNIANKSNFNEFAANFIVNLATLSRVNQLEQNSRNVSDSDSIKYERSMIVKNRIDNQCLQIMLDNPILQNMDSIVVEQIISQAIDIKLAMTDVPTLTMKEEANIRLNEIMSPSFVLRTNLVDPSRLTVDEVWDCAKRALGVGTGSVLSIAGLQALAKDGIQQVVITMSKWLAKRAGWIGAIIMVADFSSCVYAEAHD
jgi:hypothetical protein